MPRHWTEESTESFVRKITFDLITQIEKRLESLPLSQAELAQKLSVSEGAVSQSLNGSGNMTLKTIVRYARAVRLKVALVAYDDFDPDNNRGPINSDIFRICWEKTGMPQSFGDLQEVSLTTTAATDAKLINRIDSPYFLSRNESSSPGTRSKLRVGALIAEAVVKNTKPLIIPQKANLKLAG